MLAPVVHAAGLVIAIEPQFAGEPLRLDSLRYQNVAGETMSVTRLSYLLGGFALEREDGHWVELPGRDAWFDAASRRSELTLENIPAGTYRAVRFHVGPDAAANAADVSKIAPSHPLHPTLNGLHWSWQGGYIFMAIEGHFRTGSAAPHGYSYHLARDPNRTRIHLSAPLDLTRDVALLVRFDLAPLFNAPRPLAFEKDGSSTHSRDGDPIAAALVANLPGAFQVARVISAAPALSRPAPVVPIDLPETFTPYRFTVGRGFPLPELPRDNPLIEERVVLGEKLFHDTILSRNGAISCASCHQADAAFTDRLPVSLGIDGRKGDRNAMPLFNLAWKREFFWDGRATSLREQVLMPIADHREMDQSLERACRTLEAGAGYPALFRAAFSSPGITSEKISLSLEQYLLTLTARDASFDRALQGKATLTDEERLGFELFMTENDPRTGQRGADCFHCHGGALFTDHQFHDNGLPGDDPGRANVTGSSADRGKFATPSLRNISLTGPYMHDGRFATLEEVVEHYSSGIRRNVNLDPNLAKHPGNGLNLAPSEKAALVAFLKSLTSETAP